MQKLFVLPALVSMVLWGLTAEAQKATVKLADKCTEKDPRVFHGCLQLRLFDAGTRVYFDSGTDDPGEVDIFNNGGLVPSLEVGSVYFPWRLGRADFYDSWAWGPQIGVGLSSPAQNSEDGSAQASNSPVVMFSAGLLFEHKLGDDPRTKNEGSLGFEIGRAVGFSSDESLDDIDDSAWYFGLRIDIPTK